MAKRYASLERRIRSASWWRLKPSCHRSSVVEEGEEVGVGREEAMVGMLKVERDGDSRLGSRNKWGGSVVANLQRAGAVEG